ncbi:hypothetical protein MFIFM68171_10568 [Madurella fahalii]|uniref:YMC020W-like alpha/beta hydrolase domain-containing protein n=1 Tax=Madurella fahalii TaxID=1157608 RepID=A0ABQ0GRI7_9PEZI
MGSRKRVKPNPCAEETAATLTAAVPSQSSSTPSQSRSSVAEDKTTSAAFKVTPAADRSTSRTKKPNGCGDSTPTSSQGSKQVHKTRSWYGSWPRVPKSSASTQVARETILGGTSKPKTTADFSRFESKKAPDSMSINEPSPSEPALSKSREDAVSPDDRSPNPVAPVLETAEDPENKAKPKNTDTKITSDEQEQEQGTEASPQQPAEPSPENQMPVEQTAQRPASGWFGWLSRPTYTEPAAPQPDPVSEPISQEAVAPESAEVTSPETQASEPGDKAEGREHQNLEAAENAHESETQGKTAPASGSYWFWYWPSKSVSVSTEPPPVSEPTPEATAPEPLKSQVKEPEDVGVQDAPAKETALEPPAPPPKAGSTWAFWSRDTRSGSGKKQAQQGEQGQLAVMGESSEANPKRANAMEFKGTPVKEPPLKAGQKDDQGKAATTPTPSRESSSKKRKPVRPQSMDTEDATPVRPSTPKVEAATKSAAPKTPATTKALSPNLLLPSFDGTYRLKENPSIIQQITQLLLRTRQSSAKHVYLRKEPPKIKKAIAIGVHGLFPANYLRPMIGQPTGTSIKFANHCAEAIRRWADAHGCGDCDIEKIALEGEGRIGDRVENLWKLLLNWIDQIRNADLILIGCHSQGVPVSIMLLAKLIELGIVTSARVGVCAMAGVSLGPFPDYRSSMGILMGSAAELWEFSDPQSEVSKRLEASVKAVLSYGARITYVGSIDDQLVPLESAIYAPAHHPYIFRAVFIDGRIHAPDFIAHLVGFALKLRNLGVSDHGLIRELSTPLAGSLYSGEGHSRLYDDEQVYDLAVTHALETTDVSGNVPCEVHKHLGLSNPNPYHLPWIMRGLLEEDFVKTELSSETAELVKQFDDWKPVTKALKDVKYRLEAVRSKL